MPEFRREVTIERPRERVFALASDPTRAPEWMKDIVKIEMLTPGPLRNGSRFRETRRMGKREASADIEVSAHEAPSRHAARSKALGVECVYDFQFKDVGDGRTKVELRASAKGRGLSKLFAGMLLRCIEKGDGEILAHLKEVAERESR